MSSDNHRSKLHLFLSPHLDDAVLSCGGQIHQLVAAGHTVVVYTVMAGRPARDLPDSELLAELHTRWQAGDNPVQERRWEDMQAMRRLGAIPRHGSIPDCIYRLTYKPGGVPSALYPTEQSLWGAVHPADTAPMLLEATPMPYPDADVLHVPLGVGGHVDHRLVRDWGRRLARAYAGLTTTFYEEYPYSQQPEAVSTALEFFAPAQAEPILHTLDNAALEAKCAAIACYSSQISTFWAGEEEMARQVRAYASATGGGQYAEREWVFNG
ncbi:MAG: PIG-L family deacetylase [Anaerolineae bacterium]